MAQGQTALQQDRTAVAALAGDREAIGLIWQENRRWVAAVLLAHKPNYEDLEDLLQEVAMTLVSKIQTVRDHSSLRAWLRTVAVNAARAAGRSGRLRPRLQLAGVGEEWLAEEEPGPADLDDHSAAVLDSVAALPPTYREPLMLRAVHGMRSKQIADILGVPPATVDTRIARARRMLLEQGRVGVTDDRRDDTDRPYVKGSL